MTTTTTTTATTTKGILRFSIPDESVTAEQRAFFATPQNKDFVSQEVELHDFNDASSEIVKGAAGLDVQGFTWINRKSKIATSENASNGKFFEGSNIEDLYLPELERLIENVTGCKKAVAWNGVTRRKLPIHQDGKPTLQHRKGGEQDQIFDRLRRDVPFISGKSVESSIEPVRNVHVDMNNQGLRDTARYCRSDIRAAAKSALDAEDSGSENVPRYACYSVWRPLLPVKRDPMAACDFRTISKSCFFDTPYRNPADNEQREFMNTIRIILPDRESPEKQKWYYFPDQGPEDVLILKLGDTLADKDPNVAEGAPHGSPMIPGTEGVEEARCSIEVRVMAFWSRED